MDKFSILYIEDTADVADFMMLLLKRKYRDADIDYVRNGFDAANALHAKKYDVIVSDNQIPGMLGVQLAGYRKETINTDTPFVMHTTTCVVDVEHVDAVFGKDKSMDLVNYLINYY